jgi:outer membrane protein TolC
VLALDACALTSVENFPTTAEVVDRGNLLNRGPTLVSSAFQAAADERVAEIVAQPLGLQDAIEIAMLNAPELQEVYREQHVQYPSFVRNLAEARSAAAGVSTEWLALRLALLQAVNRDSGYRFADEYAEIAPAFVETAEHVKELWYGAVGAQQSELVLRGVTEALTAQAELANEQYRAGTLPRGKQARHHLALSAALKAHAVAKRDVIETREALIRELRLWGASADITLPERLPELPSQVVELRELEPFALRNRLDVLTARTRGDARQVAIAARSHIRESYAKYLLAYDAAKYQRDVVVPLTQTSLEFTQQEYNGMLVGIYDILADLTEHVQAGRDYVEALRDFWIAEAELTAALGGTLPAPQA